MDVVIVDGHDALATLTRIAEGEMDDHFADAILDRAEAYYNEHCWALVAVSGRKMHAQISGSRLYDVKLSADGVGLRFSCSCPYEGNCKHLAAFIWLVTKEWRAALQRLLGDDETEEQEIFSAYLSGLGKRKLRELLQRFAPPEFRQSIVLRVAPEDTVDHEFQLVLSRVENLYGDRYYEGPGDYETEMAARLKELEPFMQLRGPEILDVVREMWEDINHRMGEGELYDDYNDGNFDAGELVDFAAQLVFAQPKNDWASFLYQLRAMEEEIEEYNTFGGLIGALLEAAPDEVAIREIAPVMTEPVLLDLADRRERHLLADKLIPLLDTDQQIELLDRLDREDDLYFILVKAKLLSAKRDKDVARHLLAKALRKCSTYAENVAPAFEYLAELTLNGVGPAAEREVLIDYLQRWGNAAALRFAIGRRPELKGDFMALVEGHSPSVLLDYLVEEDDHARAVDLLDRHQELLSSRPTYVLLLRHATTYPDRARVLCDRMLEEYLPQAHRHAYGEVVKALELLRAAGLREEFAGQRRAVEGKYFRRGVLVGMLHSM